MTTATLWRPLVLAVIAAVIWIVHFDRWTIDSWRVPTDFYGDAPESLARLKAASEGDTWPLQPQVISRLGAPFGADWSAYPAPDKPLMLLLGALVHLVGLNAAANLGLLFAQVSATLAFYFTARWLRFRWEWAAAGALLFAYTYHTFHRGLSHFSLVFTWTVPLGMAAIWLVAKSRLMNWRRPAAFACLAAGAALGVSNPYNLLFWLQLMAWALVWQWFGDRRRANLQIGMAAVAVAVTGFILVNAEAWLHVKNPDAFPLLARNYAGTEIYALKPVEMFIPTQFHHLDFLAFFGNRYARWSPWRGEVFLPYLGLAGIAGFVWLMCATIRRVLSRRSPPGPALAIAWIMSYGTIGGITNLLALFVGFQVFRATNRSAIFISAIVLLFLIGRLSRWTLHWPASRRLLAAAALGVMGVFDQLPKPEKVLAVASVATDVKADEEFGRTLEAALPPAAMVFQLPVIGFPEAEASNQLGEYEHFRPYLATQHLRFSFGAPKLRARSRWQRDLQNLPIPELVTQLENHGFAALYLNRKGFADRGEALLHELTALGYTRRIEGNGGEQVAVVLRGSDHPSPPLATTLTYGQGWFYKPEGGWRWAYEDAALSYYNPYDHPIAVSLRLNIAGATPRQLTLERDHETLRVFEVATVTPLVVSDLELQPGVNRFKLCSDAAAIRQGEGRNQLRAFGIEESSVRVVLKDQSPVKPAFARLGKL